MSSKTPDTSLVKSSPSAGPLPPDLLVLFSADRHTTYRMSRTNGRWIDLGAFGINELSIKRNYDDSKAPAFVVLKDADPSKSGRPPKVNGSIPNLKACRSMSNSKTVVWTLRNIAHHDHVRSFATKFESQKDAELFFFIFSGLATEVEERCNKAHEDTITKVTRFFKDDEEEDEEDEEDDDDSIQDEWDSSSDKEEVGANRDADEEDKNEDDDSFEDDFENTQTWPEDHGILHPFAAH